MINTQPQKLQKPRAWSFKSEPINLMVGDWLQHQFSLVNLWGNSVPLAPCFLKTLFHVSRAKSHQCVASPAPLVLMVARDIISTGQESLVLQVAQFDNALRGTFAPLNSNSGGTCATQHKKPYTWRVGTCFETKYNSDNTSNSKVALI